MDLESRNVELKQQLWLAEAERGAEKEIIIR